MKKYVILDKKVGETPLQCAESWRAAAPLAYSTLPLAYAGRLDPMASGKLLILIGEECKNQTQYHGLDKEYEFSVLFGIESDSLDVLGRLNVSANGGDQLSAGVRLDLAARSAPAESSITAKSNKQRSYLPALEKKLPEICKNLEGEIELPYPRFSAKTVQGKPLHMWTLEGRLDEIEIPTKQSTIYKLELENIETISKEAMVEQALAKVNSIPEVTEARKALGNDFRRVDVRADWEQIRNNSSLPTNYTIANFRCIASSGTYMRTLASIIGNKLDTNSLAWHIHRDKIGIYDQRLQDWSKEF